MLVKSNGCATLNFTCMKPLASPEGVETRLGVTCRPQAANVNAAVNTTNNILRSIGTSIIISALGAVALAFAFPKAGLAWLAPFAAAGLFWTWRTLSWKRAFLLGWFAGTIFFAIKFSWFSYTVGAYVGKFAFAVVLIPAIVEALAFALTAACVALAYKNAAQWSAPLAGAAAFTVFEWLRSIGALAVPFAQIGYSQTTTPLAIFAPYIGSFGVTFVVMLLGAYIAESIASRNPRPIAIVVIVVALGWIPSWWLWPARRAENPLPSFRVAAVQGDIAQSIKWDPQNFWLSTNTYLDQTRRLAPLHPLLVVLPETVIPTDFNGTDVRGVHAFIRARFAQLAHLMHTWLIVGSVDKHDGREYNALFTFDPNGAIVNVYDKRQLVPFAESFPAQNILGWIPGTDLIGRFAAGTSDTVLPIDGLRVAPLICWESAFADLVHAQIARGADVLVIATDDAWFGESSGIFQHAQIAQMRAIETGEYVLQSASTGISGVVTPSGRWQDAAKLDRRALIVSDVRASRASLSTFARIGPTPVMLSLVFVYVLVIGIGAMQKRR